MSALDHLDDAQLLLHRAQDLRRELAHRSGVGEGLLWNVECSTADDGATHAADLVLDRARLRALKPVIGDIANNLIHALDHVASAARLQADTGKAGRLYFRITTDDANYAAHLPELRQFVGDEWADMFEAARDQHRLYLAYLSTIKNVSNEAKHWELRPGIAGANAVQWFDPQVNLVELPAGHFIEHDRFRFWEGAAPFQAVGVQMVLSFRIRGEGIDEVDLESVASTSSNFVAELIGRARDYLAALETA